MLIAIVGTLLWSDLTELKQDVKTLLIQQSSDRTRIDMLEKDIQILKSHSSTSIETETSYKIKLQVLPIWMRVGPFKKEDEIEFTKKQPIHTTA
jgi:hypothetical protein